MDELTAEPVLRCVFALAQVCQALAGDLVAGTAPIALESLTARFADLPTPTCYVGALAAIGALHVFLQPVGAAIHARAHGGAPSRCGFDPGRFSVPRSVDPQRPESWTPLAAVGAWAQGYAVAFRAHHRASLVDRTRSCLQTAVGGAMPKLDQLARDLGSSPRVVQRIMRGSIGESPRQHTIRLRAIKAFDLLRSSDWKIEAIAIHVGWQGKANLYSAFDRLLRLTPAAVRALSSHEAALARQRLDTVQDTEASSSLTVLTAPPGNRLPSSMAMSVVSS